MLILSDGRRIGTVSGGCLEGEVCRKAWWYTEDGQASVRIYDTSSDDDAVWEFGLGCNGVVHVLFERVSDAGTQEMLRFVAERRAARRPVAVATVVALREGSPGTLRCGARLLFDAEGVSGGTLAGGRFEALLHGLARDAWVQQKSQLVHLGADEAPEACDVFVEWIGTPPALVVFGAGHDAQPVVRLAKGLGWHVTVADGRSNYATRQRFPEADVVQVLKPGQALQGIEITRDTAVVMMTHNYPEDARLLGSILPAKPRYLGLLGPKSRAEELLEEVGLPVTGIDIHAPVGLDLGSDAPDSVALAIVAEIQAVLHGRAGGMLRMRQAPIHEPAHEIGAANGSMAEIREAAICDLG